MSESAAHTSWVKRPLEYAVFEESPDLEVENARLREALTYYAEGRYPDGGEIAREALLAWECAKCGEAIHDLPLGRPHDCAVEVTP